MNPTTATTNESTTTTGTILQFQSWLSSIDPSFWYEFAKKKLDLFRLSDKPVPVVGYYGTGYPGVPSHFYLNMDAFNETFSPPVYHYALPGVMHNTNTIEAFKNLDKKVLSDKITQQIWDDLMSDSYLKNPGLLNRFGLITFADLKKYHFYYWFCFPVFTGNTPTTVVKSQLLTDIFTPTQMTEFNLAIEPLRIKNAFLFVKFQDSKISVGTLQQYSDFISTDQQQRWWWGVVFVDPGYQDNVLGWPLRNFLALLRIKFGLKSADLLSYKHPVAESATTDDLKQMSCRVFSVNISDFDVPSPVVVGGSHVPPPLLPPASFSGWERNFKGEARPKFVNLSSTMDHKQLAENAVELNLKLMRWRVLPGLNLERVFAARCLLLGAGTLGCNLARNLLSWGVRKITFVDCGKVSFSNPVRQTLFTFEDSVAGKPKAAAAAEMLKKIFPNINAVGIEMTIPMPGHPVEQKNEKDVCNTIQQLANLINEHDFIFLGLDSRESRWFPTLLAANAGKAVINVALGFDTFVVMRHGCPNYGDLQTQQHHSSDETLGCYFCNDVMAPQDSITDRTLDQQCTVTRPGLSFMASAIAVELMVSILHHPKGIRAPPEGKIELGAKASTELGVVPHQIRGFLSSFQNVPMVGHQYSKCVACSSHVVSAYRKDPFGFCLSVFNKPLILEDVTGITQMKQQQVETPIDWEVDEDFDDI